MKLKEVFALIKENGLKTWQPKAQEAEREGGATNILSNINQ